MVKDNLEMAELNNAGASRTRQRMLTPNQLRAARALVGWTRADLAKRSGVAVPTITGFELQGADSKVSTLHKLKRALEAAGVEFIDEGHKSDDGGPGLRLRARKR
jgi:transcriptional regulator with XRE-family HTH domain